LVTGEGKTFDMKEKMTKMAEEMMNPFKHIRNWIKGELRRLTCLLESIARREAIE
jgi:hypothetical protein